MQTARTLALRDPAMSALLGTLAGVQGGASGGSSFGADRRASRRQTSFGADFGAPQFGYDRPFGADMGDDLGDDYGADAVVATAPVARPNPHNPRHHHMLMQAWDKLHGRRHHTHRRAMLLNPNEFSDIKVEAYVFSLNPSQFATGTTLTWGTANGWTAFKNPQVAFRAERVFVNVNTPGLVYLNTIQAANVNAQIGAIADAFSFSPLAVGTKLSLPTLPPQNTMQVTGTWSTFIPAAFQTGTAFTLAIDFQGWATVIA
jgi:hypothetical protein